MIIDIHTHMFPMKIAASALRSMQQNSHIALFSDGTEAGLAENMRGAGVDLAVVQPVATNPEKVSRINDAAILVNEGFRGTGILSFGGIHPACSYWEAELERIREAGIIGIKLHPAYAHIDIDDPRSIAILKKCRDLDFIVLLHSGKDVGIPGATEAVPSRIRNALDKVGRMKLIAAHMGGWKCWQEGRNLLPETGIFIDTAFALGRMEPAQDQYKWNEDDLNLLNEDKFCELLDAYGTDHVLFGTDSPWADPEKEIRKIRQLSLSKPEIDRILGENAKELLHSAGIRLSDEVSQIVSIN